MISFSLRQWLAPLTGFFLAISLGVLFDSLSHKFENEVNSESRVLLGGDLEIAGNYALTPELDASFRKLLPAETKTTRIREFLSMASSGANQKLCELRVFSLPYPLVEDGANKIDFAKAANTPTVYASKDLEVALGVKPGSEIQIGFKKFIIGGWLEEKSSAISPGMKLGPTVLFHESHLEGSGLEVRGSRIRHKQLIALPNTNQLEATEDALKTLFKGSDYRVQSTRRLESQLGEILGRFFDFLKISQWLIFVMSLISFFLSARHFSQNQATHYAILKLLGSENSFLLKSTISSALPVLLITALIASIVGNSISEVIKPAWSVAVWFRALPFAVLATLFASLFLLIGLWPLVRVRPLALIRSTETTLNRQERVATALLILAALVFGSLFLFNSLLFSAILCAAVLVLVGFSWLSVRVFIRVFKTLPKPTRFGTFTHSFWQRLSQPGHTLTQVSVLSSTLTLLFTFLWIQGTFLGEVSPSKMNSLPQLFLIDITEEEKPALENIFHTVRTNEIQWGKWIRAKIREVNGKPFAPPKEFENRGREVNMSERSFLYPTEVVSQGEFYKPEDASANPVPISVATTFAERAGFKLGDQIEFELQGVKIPTVLTSLRRVRWSDFRPNFFFIFPEGAVKDAPGTWIASVALAPDSRANKPELLKQIAQTHPTVTAFDIEDLSQKFLKTLEKLELALLVLGLCIVLSALSLLVLQSVIELNSRFREFALYRIVGAHSNEVFRLFLKEQFVLSFFSLLLSLPLSALFAHLFLRYRFQITTLELGPLIFGAVFVLALLLSFSGAGLALRALRAKPLILLGNTEVRQGER